MLSHRGICGGYANGTGVCTGDSGSGLIVVHDGIYYLRGIVSASLNGPLSGCNLRAYSIFTDIMEFTACIMVGKDDKTLIHYLLEKIRKCESEMSRLKKTLSSNLQSEPSSQLNEPLAQDLRIKPAKRNKIQPWRLVFYLIYCILTCI